MIVVFSTLAGFTVLAIAVLVEVFMRRRFKLSRIWADNNGQGPGAGPRVLSDDEIDLMSRASGGTSTTVNHNSISPRHTCPSAASNTPSALRLQCSAEPEKSSVMTTVTQVPCSLLSVGNERTHASNSRTQSPWSGVSIEQVMAGADQNSGKSVRSTSAESVATAGKVNQPTQPVYRIKLSGMDQPRLSQIKLQCMLCDQGVPLGLQQSVTCRRQHAGTEIQAGDLLCGDSCQLVHLRVPQTTSSQHLASNCQSSNITQSSSDGSITNVTDDGDSCHSTPAQEPTVSHALNTVVNHPTAAPQVSFASEKSGSSYGLRTSLSNKHCSPMWVGRPPVVICESQSLGTAASDFTTQSAGANMAVPCNTSVSVYEDLHTGMGDLFLQPVTVIESAA